MSNRATIIITYDIVYEDGQQCVMQFESDTQLTVVSGAAYPSTLSMFHDSIKATKGSFPSGKAVDKVDSQPNT